MMAAFAPVRRVNFTAQVVARGQSCGKGRVRTIVAHKERFYMLTSNLPRYMSYGKGVVPSGESPGEMGCQ
jgi:hypothetical protein